MKFLSEQQTTRCDDVQWSLAGLSLASWNLVISLGLLAIAAVGVARLRKERAA